MIYKVWLFISLIIPIAYSLQCYSCASDYAIENWTRFRLPMFRGLEQQSDSSCMSSDHISASLVSCTGLCVTVTFSLPAFNHTLGVVRECHRLSKEDKALRLKEPCYTETGYTRSRKKADIEYCYCQSDGCNGNSRRAPAVYHSRSVGRPHIRPSATSFNFTLQTLNMMVLGMLLVIC